MAGARPARAARRLARRSPCSTARSTRHRIAAADPYVAEVAARAGARDARRLRRGRAGGRRPLGARRASCRRPSAPAAPRGCAAPAGAPRRAARGRDAALACEELALRARLDLDAGRGARPRCSCTLALEAALAELEAGAGTGRRARLDQLRAPRAGRRRRPAGARGRAGGRAASRRAALGRLEAALRARTRACDSERWAAVDRRLEALLPRDTLAGWRRTGRERGRGPATPRRLPPSRGALLELLARLSGRPGGFSRSARSRGYGALWFARALAPGQPPRHAGVRPAARERSPARASRDAGLSGASSSLLEGPGARDAPRLEGPFDLVFLDADKERSADYLAARDLALSRPGTLIIADNVVRGGRAPRRGRRGSARAGRAAAGRRNGGGATARGQRASRPSASRAGTGWCSRSSSAERLGRAEAERSGAGGAAARARAPRRPWPPRPLRAPLGRRPVDRPRPRGPRPPRSPRQTRWCCGSARGSSSTAPPALTRRATPRSASRSASRTPSAARRPAAARTRQHLLRGHVAVELVAGAAYHEPLGRDALAVRARAAVPVIVGSGGSIRCPNSSI